MAIAFEITPIDGGAQVVIAAKDFFYALRYRDVSAPDDSILIDDVLYQLSTIGVVDAGISNQTGMIADPGQTQASGTPITKHFSKFDTVANNDDSGTLDGALQGNRREIFNNGANSMAVFPAVGEQFEGQAVDAKIDIASGADVEIFSWVNGVWTVIP